MRTLDEILAEAVVNQISSDGDKRFAVVMEDSETGDYGVQVTRFVDADRAGFVGDMIDAVAHGLTQSEAVAMEKSLNDAVARIRARWQARWAKA